MTRRSSLIMSRTVFVVIRISLTSARLILLHHLLVSLRNFLKPSDPNLTVTWCIPTSKKKKKTTTTTTTMTMTTTTMTTMTTTTTTTTTICLFPSLHSTKNSSTH